MKKHLRIRVSGNVQGVFFRVATKEKAEALGIDGFVRNEADGKVYIEAEGLPENLEAFLDWCRKGPVSAQVDRCEVEEGEVSGFQKFEIRR